VISDGYFSNGAAGWIEVICGVMFSGKSEELIRRVRRAIIAKKRVQVFKSHLDERYSGIYHVSSHDRAEASKRVSDRRHVRADRSARVAGYASRRDR